MENTRSSPSERLLDAAAQSTAQSTARKFLTGTEPLDCRRLKERTDFIFSLACTSRPSLSHAAPDLEEEGLFGFEHRESE